MPFSYSITYDTALDTNTEFYASGGTLGRLTTIHDWHGYSASGVTATSLTFGTKTWTAGNMESLPPAVGVTADLWFDTDISVMTPTLAWLQFGDGDGGLRIGQSIATPGTVFLARRSEVIGVSGRAETNDFTITARTTPTPVPEPTSMLLLGTGLVGIGARRWRRSNR